jgi:hypothetical protein
MDCVASVTLVLAVGSVLLAGWLCLPQLLNLERGPKIQNGFDGGPEEAGRYWLHEIDEELRDEIGRLGFQPVGVYWEKADLGRTFHEYVFAGPANPGFAILYPNSQIMPRRAAFLTVFTSGAVVFTKNYKGGLEAEENDFLATAPGQPVPGTQEPDAPFAKPSVSIPMMVFHAGVALAAALLFMDKFEEVAPAWICGGIGLFLAFSLLKVYAGAAEKPAPTEDAKFRVPLAVVLAEHRRHVAGFLQAGHVPVPGGGPESFIEIQRLYYAHPVTRRKFLNAEKTILGAKLVFFALGPGLLAYGLGLDNPAPWLCLLGEGLILAAIRYGVTSAGVIRLLDRMGGKAAEKEDPA